MPHQAHALCLVFPNWEGFQLALPQLVCADVPGRSAWEQSKVNACIRCNTHLPGTGIGTAPLRDEAAGVPVAY